MAALSLFKLYTRLDDCMIFSLSSCSELTFVTCTAKITALDVQVVACQDHWVITSPNVNYIPQAYIFEDEDLHVQADGRFGLVDCFQWPQLYARDYSHSVCIPHKDSLASHAIAWYTPTPDDFVTPVGSSSTIGLLSEPQVNLFDQLFKLLCGWHHPIKYKKAISQDWLHCQMRSAEHDITRLQLNPLTFRDLIVFVGQLQWTLLDIHAMLKFIKILNPLLDSPPSKLPHVNHSWMGCFTTDTKVCEAMYLAGVPVWLLHHKEYIPPTMNIINPVHLTFPDHIVRAVYTENGRAAPFHSIYHGPGGNLRHVHTCRYYEGTFANVPKPVAGPSTSSSSSSNQLSSGGKQSSKKLSRTAREKAAMGPSKGMYFGAFLPSFLIVVVS